MNREDNDFRIGGPRRPGQGPQLDIGGAKLTALVIGGLVLIGLVVLGLKSYQSVPAGHVGVATLFGKPVEQEYMAGLHFPVNPLLDWTLYDVREKTHKEEASVPSQDQLTTDIDVSVQYNIVGDQASRILTETGDAADVVNVHLIPKLRSLMREQGKTVVRAEEFFQPETQERLTRDIQSKLEEYLEPKGVNVQAVLLRDFRLPPAILQNVELKKQAEQKVEQSRAELEQVKVRAQTQVEEAKAAREAAEQEAEQRRTLADAQAYEIEKINTAIANNPAYIQLESLKALQAISMSPSSKLYFLNGDSPQPLPLMNIGGDTNTNPLTGSR
jgi:regulator of protease activity HflC (stomatin/prohibitin superfamily)